MDELQKLRRQIDGIDAEMVALLEKRLGVSASVAAYKIEHEMQVLDAARETQVIESRVTLLKKPEYACDVRRLFEAIMGMSRACQQRIIDAAAPEAEKQKATAVAYQGIPGAYSQQAMYEYFDTDSGVPCRSFEGVFRAVMCGEAEYGIVPVENSYAGSVNAVYDLLDGCGLSIVGEYRLRIDHALLGLPGASAADITDVYSHEQALMQCAAYLDQHGMVPHPYYNTAAGAKFVSETGDGSIAAIASEYAGGIYGLEVLADGISSSPENTTRFVVLARQPYGGEADKASICFGLEHKPGALASVLEQFAAGGLNMVKIESRPAKSRAFEYVFFVDFEGEGIRKKLDAALRSAAGLMKDARALGIYRVR